MRNFLTVFFLLFCIRSFGQTAILTGTVTNQVTNEPIYSANVVIQGTTIGATTDFDGKFSLEIPIEETIIEISYISYETKVITVNLSEGDSKEIEIQLKESLLLLDQVVVTGSKFEKKLSEETVSIDVIKPIVIENLNINNVSNVVERSPGVSVIDGQANIRAGSGFSYGAGSRVLLLFNDIPALSGDAGQPIWEIFPVENIGQVEIIKGAASALYGSSAMNGIINIRTAYPKSKRYLKISTFGSIYNKPKTSKSIFDGSEISGNDKAWWKRDEIIVGEDTLNGDTFRRPSDFGFSAAYRQKFGQHDLVLGAFYSNSENHIFASNRKQFRINTNYRYRFKKKEGISVGLGINYAKISGLTTLLHGAEEKDFYVPGFAIPNDNSSYQLMVDPFFNCVNDRGSKHKIITRYYGLSNDNEPFVGIADPENDLDSAPHNFYGEYQYQKEFQKLEKINLILTNGIVGNYSIASSPIFSGGNGNTIRSRNIALYSQADFKFFGKLNVSAGIRLESNKLDETEPQTKPIARLGLNYQAAEYTYLRASFGQGFRFPAIGEKFIQTNFGGLLLKPNPDLIAETGYSLEMGIKQGIKLGRDIKGFIDLAGFYTQYFDMIELGLAGEGGSDIAFQLDNIGATRIYGTEITLGAEGKIGRFPTGLMTGYTYAVPKFVDWDTSAVAEGEEITQGQKNVQESSSSYNVLKYRYKHTFTADYFIDFNGFQVGISGRYYSYMENIDNILQVVVGGIAEYRASKIKDLDNSGSLYSKLSSLKGLRETKGDFVMDTRLSYTYSKEDFVGKFSFLIKNVLNHEYALRPGAMSAPRTYEFRFDIKI